LKVIYFLIFSLLVLILLLLLFIFLFCFLFIRNEHNYDQ